MMIITFDCFLLFIFLCILSKIIYLNICQPLSFYLCFLEKLSKGFYCSIGYQKTIVSWIVEIIVQMFQNIKVDSEFSIAIIGLVGAFITAFFGFFPTIIQSNIKNHIGYNVIDIICSNNDDKNVFGQKFLVAMCGLIFIIILHIFQQYLLVSIISVSLMIIILKNQSDYMKLLIPKLFYREVQNKIRIKIKKTSTKKYDLMKIYSAIDLDKENDIGELLKFSAEPFKDDKGKTMYMIQPLQKYFASNHRYAAQYLKYIYYILTTKNQNLDNFEIKIYLFKNYLINYIDDQNFDEIIKYILCIIEYNLKVECNSSQIAYKFEFENVYESIKNNHNLINNKQSRDVLLKKYNSVLVTFIKESDYSSYIYNFYLFKFFVDTEDKDGIDYILSIFTFYRGNYLKYVALSLLTYLYYLENYYIISEEPKALSQEKLAKGLKNFIKRNISFYSSRSFNIKDYFKWLDETTFRWEKYNFSFGALIATSNSDILNKALTSLKKTIIILNYDSFIDINIIKDVMGTFKANEYKELKRFLEFSGINIPEEKYNSAMKKLNDKYKTKFIEESMIVKNLNDDLKCEITRQKDTIEEHLKYDLEDYSKNNETLLNKHVIEVNYILFNGETIEKCNTICRLIFEQIENSYLDYLMSLDGVECDDEKIEKVLLKDENLTDYTLIGNTKCDYLKRLKNSLSSFPKEKNIDYFYKTLLIKNYQVRIETVDISINKLTLDYLEKVEDVANLIDNDLIINFRKEENKYYLSDGFNNYYINEKEAEKYLMNNYSVIKVICKIEYFK